MGRDLVEAAATHDRSLLGYYGNGGYYGRNNACYDRTGCLVGTIVGAVVFALIALALLICVCVRLRRRNAQAATYTYPANAPYTQNAPYAGNGYNQGYQGQQPWGANQQAPPSPPAFNSTAEREAWEREQYTRYGEAGLAQGYPAPAGPSVQMANIPPK